MIKPISKEMREETLKFLQNPLEWGMFPVLPLKRYKDEGGFPEVGFVLAGKPLIVYLDNVLAVSNEKKLLSTLNKQEYKCFEALMNDGWMVD